MQQSTPSSDNRGAGNKIASTVRSYNFYRRRLNISFITLVLLSIMTTIYSFAFDDQSVKLITDVRLEDNMAVSGSMVAVSGLRGNQRFIYLSEDSGRYFKPVNEGWPVKDSPVFIGFTANKNLFVVEKNGFIRVKLASSNDFIAGGDSFPPPLREVRGVAVVPGTDNICLYGRFPYLIDIDIKHPRQQRMFQVRDSICSVAISPDGRIRYWLAGGGLRAIVDSGQYPGDLPNKSLKVPDLMDTEAQKAHY